MIFKKLKIKLLLILFLNLINFKIYSKQTMTISIFGNQQSLSSLLSSDSFFNDISKQIIDIIGINNFDENNNGLYNLQKCEKNEFKELPLII